MSNAATHFSNELLKQERQRRGWSREYVAEHIGIADVKTIGRWERGIAFPRAYFLQKLCDLFDMPAQALGLYQEESSIFLTDSPLPVLQECSHFVISPVARLSDPAIPLPSMGAETLVGRDETLHRLKEHLIDDGPPAICALYGLPGVGKTALAINLVRDADIQRHFSDGILWVGLGPRPNIRKELHRWGNLPGCLATEMAEVEDEMELAKLLRAAIGMRRMLLVIDDAWRNEDALAFKVGGPNCAYLLTTRLPSVALDFAGKGVTCVRELNEDDGLKLLARFVPDIVTGELHTAQALVRSVGGLPLALTLMGRYLQSQVYSGQPRRQRAALERLSHSEELLRLTVIQAPLEHHTSLPTEMPLSLDAVIGISAWQLDEIAQRALLRLSVFPARPYSFSEEAALAVTTVSEKTLDTLVDAGFIESIGGGRYTLHRTIRDFAHVRLRETLAAERMVEYFAKYIEEHQDDYEALEQEAGNMLIALQLAYEGGMTTTLTRMMYVCSPFLHTRGRDDLAEVYMRYARQPAHTEGDKLLSYRLL